jgi:uncharacterized membrane protein
MTPPALVSFYLTRTQQPLHGGMLVGRPGSRKSFQVFSLLAAGEIIADKFPQAPARTFAPALVGRLGTSALASAALCEAQGQNRLLGAALSMAVTGAATFATYRARLALNQRLPNVASGLLEDLLLVGGGLSLLRLWQRS